MFCVTKIFNDPSAGSPTDALLRLLFPLNHIMYISFNAINKECVCPLDL